MAAYLIAARTGWIFKTESVIIPAVLDAVSGAGWVRGLLPLINRLGHSLPPLLIARRLEQSPRKKWVLMSTSWLMVGCFLLWGALFSPWAAAVVPWKAAIFLAIYTVFFACVGVNSLAMNTLQGKLIPPTVRGRLMYVSSILGAISAIGCVLWLMPGWLRSDTPRFDWLFLFPGALFASAAIMVSCFHENPDRPANASQKHNCFVAAYQSLRDDQNFRKLAFVGLAAGSSILLFPHYQNLGLQHMRLDLSQLVWWVVVQNVGTGIFSIPMGAIADRGGNRLVLQIFLLGLAAAPAAAIAISLFAPSHWYALVFLLIGLTPIVIRTVQNFALEICRAQDHPRYLSTLNLCMAAPMVFAPLVGWCVDLFGFVAVYASVTAIIISGWCVTFTLIEPRKMDYPFVGDVDLL